MRTRTRLLRHLKPETVGELTDTLRTADNRARLNAARELVGHGEAAVDALIEALEDNNEEVWQVAFATLVKIGDPAVPTLLATLDHPRRNVALMAAAILLRMGIPANRTPTLRAMQQELVQQVAASR